MMLIASTTFVSTRRHLSRHYNFGAIEFKYFINHVNKRYDGTKTSAKLTFHEDEHQKPENHRACNRKYRGILKIRESSSGKGLGLFATKDFAIGDLVMSSRPVVTTKERSSHTVQIDWDRHILMDLPATLVNHSCDANLGIQNNSNGVRDEDDGEEYFGAYDFYAIHPIREGEELTWDYETSEWELSTFFQCTCGSTKCRGFLRGFKQNADMIRQQNGEYHAAYLK
ncbi:unnamed protein product [Pseudo-nitzschia multistriata]|uniref:Post-SET domain-containing protein n=1 Tax=Pseudo-nitzschia multistriata TaxID=183589 RepID=A0A448Z3I4_9STRA|nr:unnamed protein product [Pseudo-nitzschia multistriata]